MFILYVLTQYDSAACFCRSQSEGLLHGLPYYIHWRLSFSQHNAQIFHMVSITLHLVNTSLLK